MTGTIRKLLAAVCLLAGSTGPNALAQTAPPLPCLQSLPKHDIVIDGKLDDWDLTSPIVLSRESASASEGSVTSDADLKGYITSNHNDQTLFLAARIRDDRVMGLSSEQELWKNDAVEFWFTGPIDADATMSRNERTQLVFSCSLNGKAVPHPAMAVFQNDKNDYLYAGTQFAAQKTDDGYILEIAIPREAIVSPSAARVEAIGFNVSLCDQDSPDKFSRLLWTGQKTDASMEFGTLVFGKLTPDTQQRLHATLAARKNRDASPAQPNADTDPAGHRGPPKITDIAANNDTVERFGKFELTLDIAAEYDNPYDFDDIALQATFTTPSGKRVVIDGFYYQPYQLFIATARRGDWIRPIGPPVWKIRFTPTEIGRYSYVVSLKDKHSRSANAPIRHFESTESQCPGFLRVSATDRHYLEFDTGRSFFGIGYGTHFWQATPTDILQHKHHLNQLAYFGGNYTSVNLNTVGECAFELETAQTGLGRYSPINSFKFDYILEAARKRGIYILPCLNQTAVATQQFWNGCRYNQRNGGPCAEPQDYFTDPKMLKLTQQRLRYIVARWGYSPNILGWELFNEVNYTDGFQKNRPSVQNWHRQMAAYLKQIDPNRHLVTTSFGSSLLVEDPNIWRLAEIDVLTTHRYPQAMTGNLRKMLQYKLQYGKPNLAGECALSASLCGQAQQIDPEGIALHNSIWVSALSHAAGTILHWFATEYHDPLDLYEHYRAFADYAADIAWSKEEFSDIAPPAIRPNQSRTWQDLRINGDRRWAKPESDRFRIDNGQLWEITHRIHPKTNDPKLLDTSNEELVKKLPGILFGTDDRRFQCDLTLAIHAPHTPTTLEIHLAAVGKTGTTLDFLINGQLAQSLTIADRDGKNNPSADELHDTVVLPLVAENTELTIRNRGQTWVSLRTLILKNAAREFIDDDTIVFGLKGKTVTLLWLQNAQHSWYLRWKDPTPLRTVENIALTLPDMPNGDYRVEWWNTYTGRIFKEETVSCTHTTLTLQPPAFEKDIACKIRISTASPAPPNNR